MVINSHHVPVQSCSLFRIRDLIMHRDIEPVALEVVSSYRFPLDFCEHCTQFASSIGYWSCQLPYYSYSNHMETDTRKRAVNDNHILVNTVRSEDCTLDSQVVVSVYTYAMLILKCSKRWSRSVLPVSGDCSCGLVFVALLVPQG